jgi:hypothetical protein
LIQLEIGHAAFERNTVQIDMQAVGELEAVDVGRRAAVDTEITVGLLDLRASAG